MALLYSPRHQSQAAFPPGTCRARSSAGRARERPRLPKGSKLPAARCSAPRVAGRGFCQSELSLRLASAAGLTQAELSAKAQLAPEPGSWAAVPLGRALLASLHRAKRLLALLAPSPRLELMELSGFHLRAEALTSPLRSWGSTLFCLWLCNNDRFLISCV